MTNDLWRKYHCVTIGNNTINREFGKWEDFVNEIIKSDYTTSGLEGGVSFIRKINTRPQKAKEGGYYDDHENTIVIPYKATFPASEMKEELLYALLDRKLETLSRIEETRSANLMDEYRTLPERINPEHIDMFGDNFRKYSEDELRVLLAYMDYKCKAEAESITYNLRFFQDALDHELGHFFLDDIEEGGLGLFYDERYEGPSPEELMNYVYNRFNGSPLQNRLAAIYTPVTWSHILEGYNPPDPTLSKGGIKEVKELIEYLLSQRALYRLYEVANYNDDGIEWHVGTLSFLGVDESEIADLESTASLPPYFIPNNGIIFFNPVRKEIVSVGSGLPRPYTMAEIRHAEAYLREYEKILLRHELFVRMVDALMSISLEDNSKERDFYNTKHDMKPVLNESDLELFAKMKFMGQPMFQKAIEKYRLGLQLLKNGHSPQEIRKTLEYATHYVYPPEADRKYSWPSNGFKITGEIPFSSSE